MNFKVRTKKKKEFRLRRFSLKFAIVHFFKETAGNQQRMEINKKSNVTIPLIISSNINRSNSTGFSA